MYELIQAHQMNIMLGLCSVCFVIGVFALMTKVLPGRRKGAIVYLEFAAAILLFSDRLAYYYHGDPSRLGYYMVRITNFLVFFMTISVVHGFNLYLTDLCRNEIGVTEIPMRLKMVEVMIGIGWVLVIVSQFTGLYYTFDAGNNYQRGPGFLICYIIPVVGLLIQLSVIFQYIRKLSLYISIPMILFTVVPLIAAGLQFIYYGVSFTNMAIVGMAIVLYIFAIMEMNEKYEKAQKRQLDEARNLNESVLRSYMGTILAVATAVDNRSPYTKGHSKRVAEYAKEIADRLGMEPAIAYQVYSAAMLHDIGKIDLEDAIIRKGDEMSEADKEKYRQHVVLGGELMSMVDELPILKAAAMHHHERYDGKGYPLGLKGEDIPLVARIVAVVNAYDEMTSYKKNRPPLAQGKVRETILKEAGRKYDPQIVDIMVDMIDRDTEYIMREPDEISLDESDANDLSKVHRMHFEEYKTLVSDGIRIAGSFLKITMEYRPDAGYERNRAMPAMVLFDSYDRCVHRNERNIRNLHYYEFGEIWFDGHTISNQAREMQTTITEKDCPDLLGENDFLTYEVEAVKILDHVRIRIDSKYRTVDIIVALPDSVRFVFAGITGEHCTIKDVKITESDLPVPEDYIPRIAPEITLFNRKDGDLPNVQVDDYREAYSQGVPVEDGMRILFHARTMPIANTVLHCAYVLLYTSDDGTPTGENFQEFALLRLDGDDGTADPNAQNKLTVHKTEAFEGWDAWKEQYKIGLDYEVFFRRKKNKITMSTEGLGLSMECITTIPNKIEHVYAALTGNMVVLMDIRVL